MKTEPDISTVTELTSGRQGCPEHNLKRTTFRFPKNIVFTGVSGSGNHLFLRHHLRRRSATILESLSAYARQFLGQMEKPQHDSIRGLSPTISIEQKISQPKSTFHEHDHGDQ